MKRLFALGCLALTLLLAAEQKASAWCNVKFGVGLNFEFSSANNCWFWGAFHNGPPPCYDMYGGGYPYGGNGNCFAGHYPVAYGGSYGGGYGGGYAPAAVTSYGSPTYAPSHYNPYQTVNYNYYTMPFYPAYHGR